MLRSKAIAGLLLAGLLALAGGSSLLGTAEPARAAPTDMVSVIVTLKDQATLAGLNGSTRPVRLERVVRALRLKADRTQARLRRVLDAARSKGLVQSYRPFWVLNGLELTAMRGFVARLARHSDVLKITPNATISAPVYEPAASTPETNIALVGAPDLWSAGYTGNGIVVASMDTGVDAAHPDLSAQWRGGTNSWFDPNGQHPSAPLDLSGHGTRTMGVIVGRSGGGTAVGVAPDANWIAVKIFNDAGSATVAGIHAGFQWLLDPDGNPATADAPHVVNNSWTFSGSACNLEFQLDLQALRAANILPVFAAGNYGPLASTSRSPANNPEALAVGATTKTDTIWTYSSRGPTSCTDTDATYPELTAPGASIRTTDRFAGYVSPSGTSLAAPHVTGGLALLLDAHSGATATQLETALESTGVDLGPAGPDSAYGYGRLSALASYNWLGAPPPDFALDASPSSANTAQGGSVSYTVAATPQGGFSGDVELSVSGLPADASASFTPAAIAGGSGSSALAVSTAASTPPGSYPLTITGTSGGLSHVKSVTLIVDPPPDFTVSASPGSANTPPGGSAGYTVTVDPVSGFGGDVVLSVSGLPADATASFNPPTVTGGLGSSSLTITTASSTASGTYPLTITGTSGSLSRTSSVTLIVDAPDFSVSASPGSASSQAGGSVSYTATVAPVNGFGGDVALSVTGLPVGATASFTPATVTGGSGSSQLIVTTASTTPSGSSTLTVTGTSGALERTTSVTLTVTPPSMTVFPAAAVIQTGTLRAGVAGNLGAADASFYEVNSSNRVTAWYGSFQGVPNELTSLKITYQGKNSRSCAQTVAVRRVTDGAWVQLDSRNVGTTEVLIADLAPAGALGDYVSGSSGNGELRVRVRCSVTSGSFFASGNLMKLVYTRP